MARVNPSLSANFTPRSILRIGKLKMASMNSAAAASYVNGTSDKPLLYKTIGAALAEAGRLWAGREALVVKHQDVRMTWADLDRAVSKYAAGLLALGAGRFLEPLHVAGLLVAGAVLGGMGSLLSVRRFLKA